MSHKESENSTEDEVAGEQHTSRRGLLVAGAAAVVGATAVAGAATEAKAASIGPGVWTLVGSELIRVPDVSYVGNAELVRDMVKVIEAVWKNGGAAEPKPWRCRTSCEPFAHPAEDFRRSLHRSPAIVPAGALRCHLPRSGHC